MASASSNPTRISTATKDSEARWVIRGGNLRYIPMRAYGVWNEADIPLLCANSIPILVDPIAHMRYPEVLAQCRVRPSVVAVRSESVKRGFPLHRKTI